MRKPRAGWGLMPMAHDQPDNEHRLRRLGAGYGLVPKKFTAERVTTALDELLHSAEIAESVTRCNDRIRTRPGPGAMVDWIESKLPK